MNSPFNVVPILCLIIIVSLTSCRRDDNQLPRRVDTPQDSNALPQTVGQNPQNPSNLAKVDLGQNLFWDPILSGEKDVSCATCHHPSMGYADGIDLSIGVGGSGLGQLRQLGNTGFAKRNSPTIVNTAFNGMTENGNVDVLNAPMFWDNRAESLEEQAIQPILSFEEMRGPNYTEEEILVEVVNRISSNQEYRNMFNAAFGSDAVNIDRIGQAIAVFERTLVSNNAPFDRYQRGDESAMTDAQIRGFNTFTQVGCMECHSGPMFSDFDLHVMGVRDNDKLNESDEGAQNYQFRTPTLRNLNLTAPYMHNGEFATLDRVLRFYDDNNRDAMNPNVNDNDLDRRLRDLNNINGRDRDDIIAFLSALNDDSFDKTVLTSVPSGLQAGGDID